MSFESAFADVTQWIWENYPAHNGWRIVSFSWEYRISDSAQEIYADITDYCENIEDLNPALIQKHIAVTKPPEGFAYVTLQNGNERVGFNVPKHVFSADDAG